MSSNVGKVFNIPGSGGMPCGIYDPTGMREDIYAYADRAVDVAMTTLYQNLLTEQGIYHRLFDGSGDTILDSSGNKIEAKIAIEIK